MGSVHRAEGARGRGDNRVPSGSGEFEFKAADPDQTSSPSPLDLAQLIEGEIIPRLLLAHQTISSSDVVPLTTGVISEDELLRFSRMVMKDETSAILGHVDLLIRRGVAVETVYFDLLGPTAKLLGQMWEDDLCTFTDVTIGLGRLHQVVYEFSDRLQISINTESDRNALFAVTPGDQHSFGLVMVVEYFRRAGWRTVCFPDASESDLVEAVRTEHFDLIGFSMADEEWLEALPPVISELRRVSKNENVRVIVGGRVFSEKPERVALVGADETAGDAREAVKTAVRLVDPSSLVA